MHWPLGIWVHFKHVDIRSNISNISVWWGFQLCLLIEACIRQVITRVIEFLFWLFAKMLTKACVRQVICPLTAQIYGWTYSYSCFGSDKGN